MYTTRNFKTKKALKEAVAHYNQLSPIDGQRIGIGVTYFQPGPFGGNEPQNGTIYCEGPHSPAAHTWYASCIAINGYIVKVK
jgi:hypothetical protein